ncbi:DUF4097 family beta strand repeat-containing protein [Saccharothrix syringae]|uniref:DUF4097 domain-containing protein n=1 Tax=Saccharothrix syringae TaxID=103733 RepID=A0A5Q0HCF5_SACSY|nr:DUF4097 family beta strand repeat-containing protein [Saccharothrix syringae]QFZ23799.1 hypothetical protein EKG83_45820 [Saccharothrix syringae]
MVVKRIGLAAVVAVIAAVALTSCVRLVEHGFRDQHTVGDRITEVRVDNGSGDVTVRGRADGTATSTDVRRFVGYPKGGAKPEGLFHRVEGTTLVLGGCGNRCYVDYDVVLPSTDVRVTGGNGSGDVRFEAVAAVEVDLGSGDVALKQVSGPVRLDNDSGDLEAADVTGDLVARTGSGNISLSGMRGAVTLESRSGDVDVRMAAATSVRAETGSGNVTVHLQPASYRVDVGTGSGDQDVAVANDPDAASELFLRTSSGDVAVRVAQPAP